jgi:glutathione S-transferase
MSSDTIRRYHATASPNSRRVRIFLAEKALNVALMPVDLGQQEQHSEVLPRHQSAPCRADTGADRRHGDRRGSCHLALLRRRPSGSAAAWRRPAGKALVVMWERRVELEGFAAVMEGVRNAAPRLQDRAIAGSHDYEQIPALIDRSKQRVANFYGDFDARLTEVPLVAGDEFSAADITMLVTVDFAARAFDMAIPPTCGALQRWYDNVAARPSTTA